MIGDTTFQATARVSSDGEVSVKVTAVTPYGSRSASVTEEILDEAVLEGVRDLLAAAVNGVKADLIPKSKVAAAEALVVAARNKEAF